jgi:HEXXH motif-containing protein
MTTFDDVLKAVDWARMAAPQADGYDTEMTLRLARTGSSPLRPNPYQRRSVGDAAAFCDGAVAVRRGPVGGMLTDKLLPADVRHPNIPIGAALLARWPEAYAQFKRLIDTVYPYTDPAQAKLGDKAFGSSSHSYEKDFGAVLATVDHSLAFTQALIHEMAHQKLRALGVSFESAARLITNPRTQMFASPIRKDRPRPMTAVFHAQYSFIHVTALDLYMLKGAQNETERQQLLMLLARNVPRMQEGYAEIEKNIQLDAPGTRFVEAFMRWSRNVLEEGQATLDANGYGAPTLAPAQTPS